jgi:3-phosphoshikimate 1-carboxyvinyltransferase
MRYIIQGKQGKIEGKILLPSSKSISNRLLITRALSGKDFDIKNLSRSEDTRVLANVISGMPKEMNIGHAGTAMRFLTAYLAVTPGEWLLTGSERMKQRPIEKLVTALVDMGASIEYPEKHGYPPLKIKGQKLSAREVSIDGGISSQYISALLMIAPTFKAGLTINLENEVISSSYIYLTLKLMHEMGIKYQWEGNRIHVPAQEYQSKNIEVEPDWSSASYWYMIAALHGNVKIELPGLKKNSAQGDAEIARMFGPIGVKTSYNENGIIIESTGESMNDFREDFINNPDMVQSFAVALVLKGIPFCFTGTQSLRIKETDRVVALQNELRKFGATINYDKGILSWDGQLGPQNLSPITIPTYQDHRMALAFAPAALSFKDLIIEDPEVVKKSYPGYWQDLMKVGFRVEELVV